jgi:LRR receptor-like serine/threonine-protein kinase FLS2
MTNGFVKANIIGVGSSSIVYRSMLPGGAIVAIKRLSEVKYSSDTQHAFVAEYQILKRITQHGSMVRVLNCCATPSCMALVLDFMPGGTLENKLYEQSMSWLDRVDTAVSVAKGLVYLHLDCAAHKVVVDLKPSHILIDADSKAHITDLHIPRFATSKIPGTIAYCAPGEHISILFCSVFVSAMMLLLDTLLGSIVMHQKLFISLGSHCSESNI